MEEGDGDDLFLVVYRGDELRQTTLADVVPVAFELAGGGQYAAVFVQPDMKNSPRTVERCPGEIDLP